MARHLGAGTIHHAGKMHVQIGRYCRPETSRATGWIPHGHPQTSLHARCLRAARPSCSIPESFDRIMTNAANPPSHGTSAGLPILSLRRPIGFIKQLVVLLPFLLLWGCEESPDEARMRLGELGYEFTPVSMLLATDRNDHVAIRLLILAGMDPDTKIGTGVFERLEQGDDVSREFKDWIENRSGVSPRVHFDFTTLVLAAALGHSETVKVLLDAGADKSRKDSTERTAVMRATAEGHQDVVEMLLEPDTDLAQAEDADRLLTIAISNHRTDIVQLLLDAGADTFVENNLSFTALIEAAGEDGVETLAILIDAGAAVNAQPEQRADNTALMAAAMAGNVEAVRMLLDADADPNPQNKYGNTALILAIIHRGDARIPIVELLLNGGADPNLQNNEGNTALILAAGQYGDDRIPMMALLLDAGADSNLQNNEGDTILMRVAGSGESKVVGMLLDAGADPTLQNGKGDTALMLAVKPMVNSRDAWSESSNPDKDYRGVVVILLDAGADPNTKDKEGFTPFMKAVKNANLEFVKTLIEAGADPNIQDPEGFTSLMRALVSYTSDDLRRLLLDAVGDPANADLRNKHGVTALMIALEVKQPEAVRALIEVGADLDIQNNEGQTALVYAAANSDLDSVKALLKAGADPRLEDAKGGTVLNYAPRYDRDFRGVLQEAMSRPAKPPPAETPTPTVSPTASPVVEIDGGPAASLANETYLGGMKTRGMKVYALSGDGDWCAEKVVFKITAPSETVFTDGTAEFYMKRFGERINEAQFCPAARSADIHGYTDTGTEPVFTGKATAAAGWSVH